VLSYIQAYLVEIIYPVNGKSFFSVWQYVAWHLGAQETKGKDIISSSVCIGKLPHFQHTVPFSTCLM
jgi:hypothetical protein